MKRILKAVLSAGFITTAFFTGVTGNIANAAISEFTDEILTYEIVKGGVNISACDDGAVELNIRDEIDGLLKYLDHVFGEENMKLSKKYLLRLKKMGTS